MPGTQPQRVPIAVVATPHGLRGGVKVKVFNPETQVLVTGVEVFVTGPGNAPERVVTLTSVQPGPGTWIVRMESSTTRESAEALRGAEISVDRAVLPEVDEGEWYHADLVRCDVRDVAGRSLGTVDRVESYPSVDALVLAGADAIEIPIVAGIVLSVDLDARAIVVDVDSLREE